MSGSDSIAISKTQEMRTCYLSTSANIDLSTITELLAERQIQVILSADLSPTASTFLEGLVNVISDADLFIAVLSPNQNNDQVYFELGIAVANERRILVLAPPGVLPPLDIAEIPSIRADATNRDAISFMLDQVLETPSRKYRSQLPWFTAGKSQPIGDLADEILAKLDARGKQMTEVEIVGLLAQALRKSVPSHIVESPLLIDQNDCVLGQVKSAMRPDLMVWSDELGPWIGSPLIIEVRRTLRGEKDCSEVVQQTLSFLQVSRTRSALIIYVSKASSVGNFLSLSPPNVFFLDIHELLNAMRTKSFARVMIDLRNRRVHGIK